MKKFRDFYERNSLGFLLKKTFRIMKLTLFIFVLTISQLWATESYSQFTKLSLKLEEVKISDVLKEIENQSDFFFLYSPKLIDVDRTVNVDVENESIQEILSNIFGEEVKFGVYDRQIILTTKDNSEIFSSFQQKRIIGTVTDRNGAPVVGANVVITGTNQGTVTDIAGNYNIDVPQNARSLTFSFIGMESQEIILGTSTQINVTMVESAIGLEEVVVIGYGTQKKVNLTGAVSSLSGESMEGQFSSNTSTLIQGRLSGVNVTSTSGQPGKPNIRILIRGLGTMNNTNPLVLVDGIETSMDEINPNDIESISVLKDAASASIYGSRAGNGVILITTKRGSAGNIKINYNNSIGWQRLGLTPEVASSADYARLRNEANLNQGLAPAYTDDEIRKFEDGSDPFNYPNTDLMGLLFDGSGFTQNHNLFLSGGNDQARYGISLGYFEQQGVLKRTDYERYNLRINVDSKATKWLNIKLNSGLSQGLINEPTAHIMTAGPFYFYQQALLTPATVPVRNAAGEYVPYGNNNLVAMLSEGGGNKYKMPRMTSSMSGEITLLKGLTLTGLAGIDYSTNKTKYHTITLRYSNNVVIGPNAVSDQFSERTAITLQSFLNYQTIIGKHGISGMLGISRLSEDYYFNAAFRSNFPSNIIDQIDAGSASTATASGNALQTRSGSYFGRLNYSYDNKYLFEANARRDGSSRFGPENRWGLFPSFSVGWRLSEEAFLKKVSWIENLKLRASWGILGNDRIADYLYIPRISLGLNQPLGGAVANGAAVTTASNPDIRWEKTTVWDIGMDVDLFNNRLLSLSVDYYNRYTDDILASVPVSMVFGLPAPVVNTGAMRNTGVEFQLESRKKLETVEVFVSGNIAFNKNNVEKYNRQGVTQPDPGGPAIINREGDPWNSYYGYVNIGKFQNDAEAASSPIMAGTAPKAGDLKFKDLNNDGVIDPDDRTILGNTIPKITYGFNGGANYKSFDFSFSFQGVAKVNASLGIFGLYPFKDDGGALQLHLDRTMVQNGAVVKEGHLPRTLPGAVQNINGSVFSSWSLSDASYLRLKNIEVGYTLPNTLGSKIGISRARIYFNGQNLLTFTDFPSGFDPEVVSAFGTFSLFNAPQVKAYTFGISIDF